MNRNNQSFCGTSSVQIASVVPKKQTSPPNICSGEYNIQVTASLGLSRYLFPLSSLPHCGLTVKKDSEGNLSSCNPRVIPGEEERAATSWSNSNPDFGNYLSWEAISADVPPTLLQGHVWLQTPSCICCASWCGPESCRMKCLNVRKGST